MGFFTQLKHGWNAFTGRDPTLVRDYGMPSYDRPDRVHFTPGNERTIVTAIYTKIAMDVASQEFEHVKLDENNRYQETMKTGLNNCLTLEANIDQDARSFIRDIVESCCDEGVVAVVPIDTDINPYITGSYDIKTLRTGKITSWMPRHVKVLTYDDNTGRKREKIWPKDKIAIIENPFYPIMNERNSVMQRLIRKLNLLDVVDEQSSSGKLDMIIQLPYVIKSDAQRQTAERRRKDIELQLTNSKYGIAYTDGTEHITQLNRAVENNLMGQIEYLTSMLYSQLGISKEILDGTADEKTMANYFTRTIEPFVMAIVLEFSRKFLTKTARSQRQTIMFFNKPFGLVPMKDMAELGDKFIRNEIMSGNEFRQILGLKPSPDPKDDALLNKNNVTYEGVPADQGLDTANQENLQADTEQIDNDLDELESLLQSDPELYEDTLVHYASPYYDPVKAHEYYMKTRQLKGRNNTGVTLNEQGREAQTYLKYQIDTDKKTATEAVRLQQKNKQNLLSNQKSADIRTAVRNTQAEILALRQQLKGLSKSQIAKAKPFIEKRIEALRDANDQHKAEIQSRFDNDAFKLRTETDESLAAVKEEYDKLYEEELSKIQADPANQKTSSSKSGSSRSSKSSGTKSSSKTSTKDYRIWYGDKKK